MNKFSETDWARVDAMTDDVIDTSDIPPLTEAFFKKATLRMPRTSAAIKLHCEENKESKTLRD